MTRMHAPEDIINHIREMRAFAVSLAKHQSLADDLVQDALEKAWKNFHLFKDGTNLRAWLITILRNTYYSQMRKFNREQQMDSYAAENIADKPSQDGHLKLAELKIAFESLSDEHREALMLVGVLGFSYQEAAEACGVAVGTIKSRAARARTRLAKQTGHENHDATDVATLSIMAAGQDLAGRA
ncbi:MAG: sigma-70 family RNA polymerase sigma factor [Paracoccaceae bacterium]